jgi:hypothetical protein
VCATNVKISGINPNFIKSCDKKSNITHLRGMKQFYFLLIAITFSVFSFAQTEGASKIYGYRQKVMPGTVRVDDNGREVKRPTQYNYFIYLASNTKVKPIEIWINGVAYSPIVNHVSTTPVEYINPTSGDNKPNVLVPKTSKKVLQLSPSLNKIQRPTQNGKSFSSKNELVIIYKGNGKLYYKVLPNLKELEVVHMQ